MVEYSLASYQTLQRAEDYYRRLVERLVAVGSEENAPPHSEDALAEYLHRTLGDREVREELEHHVWGARIATDTLLQYVRAVVRKDAYFHQRAFSEFRLNREAEHWSVEKRDAYWNDFLAKTSNEYGTEGFRSTFFQRAWNTANDESRKVLWLSLLADRTECLNAKLHRQIRAFIAERGDTVRHLLLTNLRMVAQYAAEHHVDKPDFMTVWALMSGRWNSVEFERLLPTARLRYRFPVLETIIRRMGRTPDAMRQRHIGMADGKSENLPRAARSDIAGVGVGNNLNSLLPSEWVQYFDSDTEDIFLRRYVGHRLQTFEYQSESIHPARSLRTVAARPKGPMVLCVDSSGSMLGEAWQIVLSLVMHLSEVCQCERRECFLITFAVQARPLDLLHDRAELLRFFSRRAEGNTDARRMIEALEELLQKDDRYAGADVLWMTDFRIPIPPSEHLARLAALRTSGTRLYGLQIGIAENRWLDRFDEVFRIEEVKKAMY